MRLSRVFLRRYRFRGVHEPAPELESGIGKFSKDYVNLPERYLVRKTAKVGQKSENHPAYVPRLEKFSAKYHDSTRPWTDDYWQKHQPFDDKKHPDIVQVV